MGTTQEEEWLLRSKSTQRVAFCFDGSVIRCSPRSFVSRIDPSQADSVKVEKNHGREVQQIQAVIVPPLQRVRLHANKKKPV